MTIRVAINGYGRIGRNILRAHYEGGKKHDIVIVAVNDLGNAETNAHLTRYDTAHGKFPGTVVVDGDHMVVNGDRIRVLANRDPSKLPWGELKVDVVHECTGFFTTKEKASAHIQGGARKVIISAPGGKDIDATVVYGVNHGVLKASHTVISNASCTTNCLAPLVKPLHDKIGLVNGLMTTIHAYTNDQVLTDVYHEDLRRARSATMSMIPTKTGAAAAVGLVLPELNGKLDGYAIRVPTINVSLVDLSLIAARDTTVDEVNTASDLGEELSVNAIAYDEGNAVLWLQGSSFSLQSGRIMKVSSDPEPDVLLQTFDFDVRLRGLAWDGTWLWGVTLEQNVVRIDPVSLQAVETFDSPDPDVEWAGIASAPATVGGGTSLYLIGQDDATEAGVLIEVQP